MAPIRRYLRISAHSVLEARIYLDDPADARRWLLHAADPALPRIIQAVRPFVLPKLREEAERAAKRAKGKGGARQRAVKDVVQGDDFQASVFLTDLSTPHSLLTRAKVFEEKGAASGSGGQGGRDGTRTRPVEVGDEADDVDADEEPTPGLRREESDEDQKPNLADIPMAGMGDESSEPVQISESDEEAAERPMRSGRSRIGRPGRRATAAGSRDDDGDDKKKLGFRTSYDGFRIHGRILCLVIKRKGGGRGKTSNASAHGQAMMENWIASTQENQHMLDDP